MVGVIQGRPGPRAIGLRAATDGEYRRAYWHYDFVAKLDGSELYVPEQKIEFKGGVLLKMSKHWAFAPALGVAINTHEGSRSSLFGDTEVQYVFAKGAHLGTGLTWWDMTHRDIFTTGWLGTAGVPVWTDNAKYHQLSLDAEWRQFFDRGSDPDVNYQFWAGLKYLLK